jgi:hypothetical protein
MGVLNAISFSAYFIYSYIIDDYYSMTFAFCGDENSSDSMNYSYDGLGSYLDSFVCYETFVSAFISDEISFPKPVNSLSSLDIGFFTNLSIELAKVLISFGCWIRWRITEYLSAKCLIG